MKHRDRPFSARSGQRVRVGVRSKSNGRARFETCPVCTGSGTRTRGRGIFRPGVTPRREACPACRGDGILSLRRLRSLVLSGIEAMRRDARMIASRRTKEG